MMDGIGDLELRHGARRAQAYARAEPVIRCIEAAIHEHRQRTGDIHAFPETGGLVAACRAGGVRAPRGGAVTHGTIARTLKLMGLHRAAGPGIRAASSGDIPDPACDR